ncbi:MAG: DEAD/DEAH box helicase family protein [Clostridia bacterium]|nr:DEAD/DEAH box helicase family protein [Clostridia bacterium]
MKFKFKIQTYQTEAVEAVVKVFEGQPFNDRVSYLRDTGIVQTHTQTTFLGEGVSLADENGNGFENAQITLSDAQLLDNIRETQTRNNLKLSSSLSQPLGQTCRCSLDIEMETGTGKTYCYIKTIFELNKRYGWSKFIVVVPSIAIREGVKKSFEMTEDHFFEQYGKKARYFIYNSKNLNSLDNFSASKDIYVMIINSQAFASSLKEGAKNEAARIIYSKQDSFGSRRPIDVIAANRPIVILDEPQKLGGEATQTSLKYFKPLFSLNYSATHKETHNLVYVLDALDAYNKKLVKKIQVKGFELKNLKGTDGFVYLSKIIISPDKPPVARVAFEINYHNGIKRESRLLKVEDNLFMLSAGKNMPSLEEYRNGYVVKEINPINNTISFLNGLTIGAEEAVGNVNEMDIRRIQIRETILSHFEKEEKLFNYGIKCLSLFFIDEVAHYRQYDDGGNELLGDFGKIFEDEYTKILNDHLTLIETPYIKYLKSIDVQDTHKGYFSIDKKGHAVNSTVNRKGECEDISAYDLILKNKERLLSFEEPTRFIFSHSALREGWDNPNVFQICTLKQSNSEVNKRQEVGRGMRLCVNKSGERIDSSAGVKVHDINVLTVIASDSYKQFVDELQKDIRKTLYERPSQATKEYFAGKHVVVDGQTVEITKEQANKIERYLGWNGYIDYDGNVTESYRQAVATGNFAPLPPELEPMKEGIHKLVQAIFDESVIIDMVSPDNKPQITDNSLIEELFAKKEFQNLWKRINHKYAYSVEFDSNELIEKAVKKINEKLFVTKLTYVTTIGAQGSETIDFVTQRTRTGTLSSGSSNVCYDLIGNICQRTKLTRKTVVKILKGLRSDIFAMFKNNPEEFIKKVSDYIIDEKATMIVDQITYNVTDEQPYSSDIFTVNKGLLTLDRAYKAERHITPYVICDSNIERDFATELDHDNEKVCVYAKLPTGFKIPTPVGDYSPDWAISFYEGTVKYIYFVAETKGSMDSMQYKGAENAKIEYAKRLFASLNDSELEYDAVDSYGKLLDIVKL